MYDSIRLADVSQELISQSLTLAGTLNQSGDIHNLDSRGYNTTLGLAEFT
jgi:hypothetical protein